MIEKMKVPPLTGSRIYDLFFKRPKAQPKTKAKIRKKCTEIDTRYDPALLKLEYQNIGNIIFYSNRNL